MDSLTVIMAAMNSKRLIEALCWRWDGSLYRQAWPCVVKPPNPHSQASEKVVEDGLVKQMLLMLTPLWWRCVM